MSKHWQSCQRGNSSPIQLLLESITINGLTKGCRPTEIVGHHTFGSC